MSPFNLAVGSARSLAICLLHMFASELWKHLTKQKHLQIHSLVKLALDMQIWCDVAWCGIAPKHKANVTPKVTKRAFFDVAIGGKATGRWLGSKMVTDNGCFADITGGLSDRCEIPTGSKGSILAQKPGICFVGVPTWLGTWCSYIGGYLGGSGVWIATWRKGTFVEDVACRWCE